MAEPKGPVLRLELRTLEAVFSANDTAVVLCRRRLPKRARGR